MRRAQRIHISPERRSPDGSLAGGMLSAFKTYFDAGPRDGNAHAIPHGRLHEGKFSMLQSHQDLPRNQHFHPEQQ